MSSKACSACDTGVIQHTSFMNEDGVSCTNVYGCNRCTNGWHDIEVLKQSKDEHSFPITDPAIIKKLDSLTPEQMEKLNLLLEDGMKELREKYGKDQK